MSFFLVVISPFHFSLPLSEPNTAHPSAPFLLATAASSGVSAFASTLRSRRSSAQRMNLASWLPLLAFSPLPFSPPPPVTDGGASGSAPRITLPLVPSSVSSSPSPKSHPPRLAVLERSSTESSETPQTQGLPLKVFFERKEVSFFLFLDLGPSRTSRDRKTRKSRTRKKRQKTKLTTRGPPPRRAKRALPSRSGSPERRASLFFCFEFFFRCRRRRQRSHEQVLIFPILRLQLALLVSFSLISSLLLLPPTSSGDVSFLTKMTLFPCFAAASAASAENTAVPTAAPGDAASPLPTTLPSLSAFLPPSAIRGCSSWSRCLGSTIITASSLETRPSFSRSKAIFRAAAPVRLPLRVWIVFMRKRECEFFSSFFRPLSGPQETRSEAKRTRLEHEQDVVFDRELAVLDVAEVVLEELGRADEVGVGGGEGGGEEVDRERRPVLIVFFLFSGPEEE